MISERALKSKKMPFFKNCFIEISSTTVIHPEILPFSSIASLLRNSGEIYILWWDANVMLVQVQSSLGLHSLSKRFLIVILSGGTLAVLLSSR